MASLVEEEEEESNNKKQKNNNKKKRKVGLASSATDEETVKRVMALAREGRLAYLKKRKAEANGVPLKMGLAVVDKAVRQRISKMGAAAMKETYDISYFSRIGTRGGREVLERYSVEYFSDLGKMKKKNKKGKGKT
jgi:hypothetical protein